MAHPVTFKGSRLARWILKAFGWKLAFDGFPTLQGVAIVYPHTSNWDFTVGILAKWALGIPARFWGKDSLFKFPVIGAWMRWIGGVPIDRSSPKGVVGEMVQVFEQHKREGRLLWMALAPEGTRSLTPGWRSGFYQVARGAEVPLALVKLDWGTRTLSLVDFYNLTGDVDADYAHLTQAFQGVKGYHAEQASPVLPWSPVSKSSASAAGSK
ncbi:MAG: 1-acyl-sn-glycerol-3-phosphate acyltransferase [Limnohabitans sp.]